MFGYFQSIYFLVKHYKDYQELLQFTIHVSSYMGDYIFHINAFKTLKLITL